MVFSEALEVMVSPKFSENNLIAVIENIFDVENVTIKNIEFKSDQKKGDSYLSTVNTFTVEAQGNGKRNGETKLIVLPILSKSIPKNIAWRKTFRSLDFFRNEVIFYNIVWKAMNKFQQKKGVIAFYQIPLCLSALSDGSNDYVVLENMNHKGFVGLVRSDGLDFEHTRIILRVFARFHALGLAFKDQEPEEFELIANSLQETYVSETLRSWYSKFQINNLLPVVYDAVEKQLPKFYLERVQECMSNDFYGKLIEKLTIKSPLTVVTHGDAWAPNFLIKYGENNIPQDAVMIDFQMSRYASLAQDLTFFLYSCTSQSLRLKYWNVLIEDYHKVFTHTLEQLGSSPALLTLNSLTAEIKSCAIFGLGMSMEAVPMAMLEDNEVADLEELSSKEVLPLEKVLIVHPFKSEEKRQRIADIIKHAVDHDFI